MFIELTEIVANERMASYASTPKERLVSINPQKIQAFFSEVHSSFTIIQVRRDNIKVKEDYETVKKLVQASCK